VLLLLNCLLLLHDLSQQQISIGLLLKRGQWAAHAWHLPSYTCLRSQSTQKVKLVSRSVA
jgi:hypothetical protein